MAGKGGYQPPSDPAPVSGPGAMSKRTDGGPADQKPRWVPTSDYGGATEMQQIQSQAPLQGTVQPAAIPLDAPTNRPQEPVTAGSPMGPGPGPNPAWEQAASPVAAAEPDQVSLIVRAAYAAHPSPELQALVNQLDAQGR